MSTHIFYGVQIDRDVYWTSETDLERGLVHDAILDAREAHVDRCVRDGRGYDNPVVGVRVLMLGDLLFLIASPEGDESTELAAGDAVAVDEPDSDRRSELEARLVAAWKLIDYDAPMPEPSWIVASA